MRNFIKKWIIENGGKIMLTKLFDSIKGYKTYTLSILGILIALAGHFYGPVQFGSLSVPYMGWSEVWNVIWTSGLFSALRHGSQP